MWFFLSQRKCHITKSNIQKKLNKENKFKGKNNCRFKYIESKMWHSYVKSHSQWHLSLEQSLRRNICAARENENDSKMHTGTNVSESKFFYSKFRAVGCMWTKTEKEKWKKNFKFVLSFFFTAVQCAVHFS